MPVVSIREAEAELAELQKSLALDPNDLDAGALEQAVLHNRASDWAARLAARRDEMTREAEAVRAAVDAEIRAAAGKDKLTETFIKRQLQLDDRIVANDNDIASVSLLASRFRELKDSYDQRKHAMRTLADLYSSEYWSRDIGMSRRERGDAAKERVRETIGSKRKR